MKKNWVQLCNQTELSNADEIFLNKLARYHNINYKDQNRFCQTLKTNAQNQTSFKNHLVEEQLCANHPSGIAKELADILPERFITYDDNGKNFYCDDVFDLETQFLIRGVNPLTRREISYNDRARIQSRINSLYPDDQMTMVDRLAYESGQIFRNTSLDSRDEWPLQNFYRMRNRDFALYIQSALKDHDILSENFIDRLTNIDVSLSLRKLTFCKAVKLTLFYIKDDQVHCDFKKRLNNSMLHFNHSYNLLTDNEINNEQLSQIQPIRTAPSPSPSPSPSRSRPLFPNPLPFAVEFGFTRFDDIALYVSSWEREADLWELILPGIQTNEFMSFRDKVLFLENNVNFLNRAPAIFLENIATLHGLQFPQNMAEVDLISLIEDDMRSRRNTLQNFFNVFWHHFDVFQALGINHESSPFVSALMQRNDVRLELMLNNAPDITRVIAQRLQIYQGDNLITAIKSKINISNEILPVPLPIVEGAKFNANSEKILCLRIQNGADFPAYKTFFGIGAGSLATDRYVMTMLRSMTLSLEQLIELANIQRLEIPTNPTVIQLYTLINTDLDTFVSKNIVKHFFFRTRENQLIQHMLIPQWGRMIGSLNRERLIERFNNYSLPLEVILRDLRIEHLRTIANDFGIPLNNIQERAQLLVLIKMSCFNAVV